MVLPRLISRILIGLTLAVVLSVLAISAGGCGPAATAAAQGTASAETGSAISAAEAADESIPGSAPVTAAEEPAKAPAAAPSGGLGGEGLFNGSVIHEIAVSFAPEDYDSMIQAYQQTGEKEWIEATVTIDGETYDHVGVRLKGNSSIMGLRRGGPTTVAGGANGGGANAGSADAGGVDAGDADAGDADAAAGVVPRQGFVGPMGGPGGNVSADSPEGLPWLIDLDRYLDNQNHEGIIEIAVRSNTTKTALNEAVSLGLLRQAGLASQEAAYASFSINGSEPVLRLVVENPDDLWMAQNFDISGALYKAESTGDYTYRGEDPGSYDGIFDQEAGKKNADLTPLIEFLDFINNADDATFNAELPSRLDIDAFATYLAMQELIANQDDIDGPGNNSYLYYDTKTEKFTVVAWDHNLAFGSMGGAGGFGGGARAPEGFRPPEGAQTPAGATAPAGAQQRTDRRGGLRVKSNVLVERFNANPEWRQLYQDRLVELRTELYASGAAAAILEQWVTVLKTQASDLVDAATVDQEAATISRYFAGD